MQAHAHTLTLTYVHMHTQTLTRMHIHSCTHTHNHTKVLQTYSGIFCLVGKSFFPGLQHEIHCQESYFFFFKILFFLFLPKAPRYIVVYSSLWVLLVVACGTLPQRGLMNSAMSAPRVRTNETLGLLQQSV